MRTFPVQMLETTHAYKCAFLGPSRLTAHSRSDQSGAVKDALLLSLTALWQARVSPRTLSQMRSLHDFCDIGTQYILFRVAVSKCRAENQF